MYMLLYFTEFTDLLQNIYANNVQIEPLHSQNPLPKATALLSNFFLFFNKIFFK